MEDEEEEKFDKTGGSTRATSLEPETSTTHLESSHPREQPKKCDRLSPSAIMESTISSPDRSSSFSIALSHDRVEQTIREGNRGAAATIHLSHIITSTPQLPEHSQVQGRLVSGEQWEIIRIADKRQIGTGYEYKVCWKETWLLECELGNAQELLREFEFQRQAQRGRKWERRARADYS